ncbi:MAG: hypothetical protein F6K35_07970 [Okeania sp. SIO2H7]|nr:hypothetical protein [Okeania sp. SIO2H7]
MFFPLFSHRSGRSLSWSIGYGEETFPYGPGTGTSSHPTGSSEEESHRCFLLWFEDKLLYLKQYLLNCCLFKLHILLSDKIAIALYL